MEKDKEDKIQWHPAFVAALKLELNFLLIKKKDIEMEAHEWGQFFEKHNLFEYKGIGDVPDWRVFSKGLAYTYLYASKEKIGERREWQKYYTHIFAERKAEKSFKRTGKAGFSG